PCGRLRSTALSVRSRLGSFFWASGVQGFIAASGTETKGSAPGGRSGRHGLAQRALVEDGPGAVGIVQHRAAAGEAAPLVEPPGRGVAVARLEHKVVEALGAREPDDGIEQGAADTLAADFGQRVHALDLADAVAVTLEGADADGAARFVAGDEQG